MIFEPEYETLPQDQMRDLQGARLRDLVAYVHARVPMYRDRLALGSCDRSNAFASFECISLTARS